MRIQRITSKSQENMQALNQIKGETSETVKKLKRNQQ